MQEALSLPNLIGGFLSALIGGGLHDPDQCQRSQSVQNRPPPIQTRPLRAENRRYAGGELKELARGGLRVGVGAGLEVLRAPIPR